MNFLRRAFTCCGCLGQTQGRGFSASGKTQLEGLKTEELATFGAGCYWGTEKFYIKNFHKMYPGCILGHSVGFMSPS